MNRSAVPDRLDVLLVHVRIFPAPSVALAALITWARRDPDLNGVALGLAEFEQGESADQVARAILARGPKLVGFSSYVWNHLENRAVARQLKKINPNLVVVFGGPQVATEAQEELDQQPEIDYVCTGEGEETFRRLLRFLFKNEGTVDAVPGLAFRAADGVRRTADAPLIDLKDAVSPYLGGLIEVRPTDLAVIEISRGCPFTCTFCDWGPRVMRYVPDERIEAEFSRLAHAGSPIKITDADLLINEARAVRILEMFLRATQGTSALLNFDTNPVFLTPRIVDVLARAPGRISPVFGLQSIREEVLRRVERKFDRAKVERNLAHLQRESPGTPIIFSTIFGLPGDDLQGVRETVDWCLRWHPTHSQLSHMLILPATEMKKNARELGFTFQNDPPNQLICSETFSRADIAETRVFAAHLELLFAWPQLYARLLAAADRRKAEPLAYVRVIESWIGALKSAGVELPGAAQWGETGGLTVQDCADLTRKRIQADLLLQAAITHVTDTFVETGRTAASLVSPRPSQGAPRSRSS